MTLDQLKQMIRTLGKSGSISISNRQILEREAYKMGISDDDLQRIIDEELLGIKSNADSSSTSNDSALGLKVSLGKKVSNPNIWNPNTDTFGRTPDATAQTAESSQTSSPSGSTLHSDSATSNNPTDTAGTADAAHVGSSSVHVQPASNDSSSQTSSSKWILIAAVLLFIGGLAFFLFGSNVNCNGTVGSSDSSATNNPVNPPSNTDSTVDRRADSTSQQRTDSTSRQRTDSTSRQRADSTSRQRADSSSRQQRADSSNTAPRRNVTDLDRLASKILEEQGDKHKQNNDIEKAKQLYDSAARKDPDNLEVKRKLDELRAAQP